MFSRIEFQNAVVRDKDTVSDFPNLICQPPVVVTHENDTSFNRSAAVTDSRHYSE